MGRVDADEAATLLAEMRTNRPSNITDPHTHLGSPYRYTPRALGSSWRMEITSCVLRVL